MADVSIITSYEQDDAPMYPPTMEYHYCEDNSIMPPIDEEALYQPGTELRRSPRIGQLGFCKPSCLNLEDLLPEAPISPIPEVYEEFDYGEIDSPLTLEDLTGPATDSPLEPVASPQTAQERRRQQVLPTFQDGYYYFFNMIIHKDPEDIHPEWPSEYFSYSAGFYEAKEQLSLWKRLQALKSFLPDGFLEGKTNHPAIG